MDKAAYTLKGCFKRGNGWRAMARCKVATGELDGEGRKRYEYKEKGATIKAAGKREAERLAREWVDSLNAQARTEGITPAKTVGEYLDAYLDAKETSAEKSTLSGYRRRAAYIKDGYRDSPGLGNAALDDLTPDMVRAWLKGIHDAGLSAQSANDARTLLKSAMRDATLCRRIDYNPVDLVDKIKADRKEPNALDAAERARLIDDLFSDAQRANESPALRLGIILALFTAMREGEICGLRWRNVDLQLGVIKVREAVGRDGEGSYLKAPKTATSRRDIPIPQALIGELREHRRQWLRLCGAAGVPFSESFFVLGDIDGSHLEPRLLYRAWKRRVERLGLMGNQGKVPTFHDLRHTFATAAVASGTDIKSVSSIMGHSNAAMTLNIYASSDPEAKRRAMERMSAEMMTRPKAGETEGTEQEGRKVVTLERD